MSTCPNVQDELEPLPAPASSHRRPMSASPANNGKGFMATRKPLAMHQNSSQVANLWNPVTGVRDAQRRAGMTPVNHARDNLLAIKELSLKNKAKRELAEANKQAPAFKARPAPSSRSSSRTVRYVLHFSNPNTVCPYTTDTFRLQSKTGERGARSMARHLFHFFESVTREVWHGFRRVQQGRDSGESRRGWAVEDGTE